MHISINTFVTAMYICRESSATNSNTTDENEVSEVMEDMNELDHNNSESNNRNRESDNYYDDNEYSNDFEDEYTQLSIDINKEDKQTSTGPKPKRTVSPRGNKTSKNNNVDSESTQAARNRKNGRAGSTGTTKGADARVDISPFDQISSDPIANALLSSQVCFFPVVLL
jgi:hypothetical protein